MNKIRIANWLLTRRCNLKCSYCRIATNCKTRPHEYPSMDYYYKNEMSTETVLQGLSNIKRHNPDCFNIFYGGEPLLRKDLPEIIQFCNNENIHYTIISNNSDGVQPAIKELFEKVDVIKGFSSSVDPLIFDPNVHKHEDRYKKSIAGFERLKSLKGKVKDLVAEITVSNENVLYLYPLVKELSEHGISSSITFIDIAKSDYYDFSNVTDKSALVEAGGELFMIFERIINDKLDVHMAEELLPQLFNNLPSNYDCKLEENLTNITIDADSTMRICLRIRGVKTPSNFTVLNFINEKNGHLKNSFIKEICNDKLDYCLKCHWSCPIMSDLIDEKEDLDSLIHSTKRS